MFRICISCLILLSTIIYSVVEKNNANKILKDNCIEVYLYKEFISPENNIALKNSDFKNNDEKPINTWAFDTIEKKVVIKHGGFKNKMILVESTPYIKNYEINFFRNFKDSATTLVLRKKIRIENKRYYEGKFHLRQFVILVNKKPTLNGYLFCSIASSICENTNILIYEPAEFRNELLLLDFSKKHLKNINLKQDYPELYQAFKNSNRLIE